MEKVNSDELKDFIQVIVEGKSLKVKDANHLVHSLLSAMIINDNKEDDIINLELKQDNVKAEVTPAQGPSGTQGAIIDNVTDATNKFFDYHVSYLHNLSIIILSVFSIIKILILKRSQ